MNVSRSLLALALLPNLTPRAALRAQAATSPQPLSSQTAQTASSTQAADPRIQWIQPLVAAVGSNAAAGKLPRHKDHVTLTVDAAAATWTDTGVAVQPGETLLTTATGQIVLAEKTLTPDGALRGWRDMLRHFPVDTANAGALVGRIGDNAAAVPFVVGAQSTFVPQEAGRLYLRVNSSAEMPAQGTVHVDLRFVAGGGAVQGGPRTSAAAEVRSAAALAALPVQSLDAMPRRVADRDGVPGDAINFALLGSAEQVRAAFARAGWVPVDTDATAAVLHGLLNTLEHKPYVEVPMSTLYLFGRPQDLSFARASAISVATERHHLRCWQTEQTVDGKALWLGAATHDVGLERDRRNGNITHRIAPEIDLERDFLRDSFQSSGSAAAAAYFLPANPVRAAETATGGSFLSDGRMLLLELR